MNLTGDAGQEYLNDSLTQDMIARLGSLHPQNLGVIARTSVMRYKKTETPIDQSCWPCYDYLRSEPRFEALLSRMGIPVDGKE